MLKVTVAVILHFFYDVYGAEVLRMTGCKLGSSQLSCECTMPALIWSVVTFRADVAFEARSEAESDAATTQP